MLGGLQYRRATARQRRRELPGRHQQREVPGDDLGADADRLLARIDEEIAVGDRNRLALDLGRPARVVAEVLGRQADIDGLRVNDGLAVVERLDLGKLIGVVLDQVEAVILVVHGPSSKAARADRTARSTSSAPDCGTCEISSPLAGSNVANVDPASASTHSPLISIRWSRCAKAAAP